MATYYISANATDWTTFASAGIVQCQLTLSAMATDRLTFAIDPTTWTAAATYATGATLYFKRDSTVFFVGRVAEVPREATGTQHTLSYLVQGPWARLEGVAYGQTWKLRGTDHIEVDIVKPRVVLGQNNAGAQITNGAQIAAVIDYAIARGIPILKGTVDAGIAMPYDEQRQLSCADAVRKCLRWVPDWVCWWDYSTQDAGVYKPTFHARAVSNLSTATLDLTSATKPEEASLRPRADLVVPGFRIVYEKTHTYDNNTWNSYELDTAGSYTDPEAVDLLFELQGDVITVNRQTIEVAAYPDFGVPAQVNTFFRLHLPWLADIDDADIVISAPTRSGAENYDSYITEGAVPDWLLNLIDVEKEIVTATVAYVRRDGSANPIEDVAEKKISVKLLSTNGTSRQYKQIASISYGETTPVGVAAALYASWTKLHYEGTLALVQAYPDFAYVPGYKLNISNGLAAWATMDAIIQEATISLFDGTTTFRIGPPGRLDADTLVALFRATHNRCFSWSRIQRTSSALAGAETDGPKNLPRERHSDGDPGLTRRLQVRAEDPDANLHVLDFAPEDVEFADAGDKAPVHLSPRELLIPELSGASYVLKRRQVLASASYHAAVPLSGATRHPFRFTQTSSTGGDIESGYLYFNGVQITITGLPASLASVTTTTRYYIAVTLSAGTAEWLSTSGAFPDDVDDTEIYPILALTCADSVIADIKQHRWSDIVVRYAGAGGLDLSKVRLGYSVSGTTLTLLAGSLKLHGQTTIAVAQANYALTGTQYFYVHHVRGSGAAAWAVAGAMPGVSSDLDVFCFKFVDAVLTQIGHIGDINLDLPLA